MSRSSMPVVLTAVAGCLLGSALLAPGGEPTWLYELSPESSYTHGCFAPCRCPLLFRDGVTGTFRLRLTESDPLYTTYDVTAVDWRVPGEPPRRVTGSGTYRVGGEFAARQELVLDLSIDGAPAERFRSPEASGGGGFPQRLDAEVSVNGRVCLDTLFALAARRVEPEFVRGDCNSDGRRDISDAVTGLLALFSGREPVSCTDACDSNDDGAFDVSDPIHLLNHLFVGGPAPSDPFPDCGADPTLDDLPCGEFAACASE